MIARDRVFDRRPTIGGTGGRRTVDDPVVERQAQAHPIAADEPRPSIMTWL